jgi:L-aspartate oxidase
MSCACLCGITWHCAHHQTSGARLATYYLAQQEIDEYYANFRVSNNLLELRNLVQVAELIVRCAMERKESRGLHYTLDYPDQLPESGPTVLSPRTYMNK